MGLDITVRRVKEHRCPDCGRVVFSEVVEEEASGGRDWYPFLESVGYYVEDHTEENERYGENVTLTDEQTMWLLKHFPNDAYNARAVLEVISAAITLGDRVNINADW